ncbi:hypothetical protein F4778DRAFT_779040 [Xylariomycetidae sp. FL2044]|nr:hypothetical protein F4778DRAFT_779040 [Xylariomycetidae sp. FL2044]
MSSTQTPMRGIGAQPPGIPSFVVSRAHAPNGPSTAFSSRSNGQDPYFSDSFQAEGFATPSSSATLSATLLLSNQTLAQSPGGHTNAQDGLSTVDSGSTTEWEWEEICHPTDVNPASKDPFGYLRRYLPRARNPAEWPLAERYRIINEVVAFYMDEYAQTKATIYLWEMFSREHDLRCRLERFFLFRDPRLSPDMAREQSNWYAWDVVMAMPGMLRFLDRVFFFLPGWQPVWWNRRFNLFWGSLEICDRGVIDYSCP